MKKLCLSYHWILSSCYYNNDRAEPKREGFHWFSIQQTVKTNDDALSEAFQNGMVMWE